jgi:hypothetical protein
LKGTPFFYQPALPAENVVGIELEGMIAVQLLAARNVAQFDTLRLCLVKIDEAPKAADHMQALRRR